MHERLYRIENAPIISDDDFDLLMRELRELEASFPQFADTSSPAQKVGADRSSSFESRAHLSPMLSLDNVFDSQELEDFDTKLKKTLGLDADTELSYSVEPKIDGAGISAVYRNGKLEYLLTRGDGEKGDDITRNVLVFKNVPLQLASDNPPELLEIRGEAYMTNAEFERLKDEARQEQKQKLVQKLQKESGEINIVLNDAQLAEIEKSLPANPRNLAAGTMKLLDAKTLANRSLMVAFYSVGESKGFEFSRQTELPQKLKDLGLPCVNWHESAKGAHQAFEKISELEELRGDFDYNTDGAVIKLDDTSMYARAGFTAHAPRWAIAWKYRAVRERTKLLSITEQVGRTGVVTPVAELEPVLISGSTVSRATLHNAGYIAAKDIRAGDTVIIEKAGEIIPAVVGVDLSMRHPESEVYKFPEHCPECGSKLKRFGEKMLYRCPNFACPPQVRGRLEHFASRDCMDIRGMGESVVEKLVATHGLKDPSDIYKLTRQDLLGLEKFKDKSADNLLSAIEQSKTRDLWRLIFGLGILEIGEQFAKALAKKFGSLDALIKADIEEIKELEGFGGAAKKRKSDEEQTQPVRALSVRAFFDDPHNLEIIERLRACGLNFESEKSASASLENSPFFKKTFVITGKLNSMGRNQAKAKIEEFGGSVASAVSSNTDFLISDGETKGSKMKAALEHGTKIIGESDFLEMLELAQNMANARKQSETAQESQKSIPALSVPTAEEKASAPTPLHSESDNSDPQLSLF